jgi:predicted signal transduction protein with EAL and GGDEF domain
VVEPVKTPPTGDLTRTLTHEGRERSYLLHVPETLDFSQPAALVLSLHGDTRAVQLECYSYLAQAVRAADIAARFGGDEFVILLPETNGAQAVRVAERIREYLFQNPVVIDPQVFIKISMGIVSIPLPAATLSVDALLEEADGALYKAKQLGRNQVYLHEKQAN